MNLAEMVESRKATKLQLNTEYSSDNKNYAILRDVSAAAITYIELQDAEIAELKKDLAVEKARVDSLLEHILLVRSSPPINL